MVTTTDVLNQHQDYIFDLMDDVKKLREQLFGFISLQNSINDDFERELHQVSDIAIEANQDASIALSRIGTGGTGGVSQEQFQQLYSDIEQAFLTTQRADLFMQFALLDLARHGAAPSDFQDILIKGIEETGAFGITPQLLEEYSDRPHLMNAPFTQVNEQQSFWDSLIGGVGAGLGGGLVGFGGMALLLIGGFFLLSGKK